MKTKVTTDAKAAQQQLRTIAKKQLAVAAKAAKDGVEQEVMALSKQRAPYEFGTLVGNAFVDEPNIRNGKFSIEFGYKSDDPLETYIMIRQHEDPDFQHPGKDSKSPDPARAAQGEFKYLESAVREKERSVKEFVEDKINQFIRGLK